MRAARTLAGPLSAVYLVLVAYASLYPFAGWRWPPGHKLQDLMVLPWLPWAGHFDDATNLLGYALLGLLLFTATTLWPVAENFRVQFCHCTSLPCTALVVPSANVPDPAPVKVKVQVL